MLQKILDTLDGNPELKAETAVFITFDEGGGYYDSGFIQPSISSVTDPAFPLSWCHPIPLAAMWCTAITTTSRS
jgi:phospholipase C